MRRSPGGRTGSSWRIRPEEPPSSATVTTAVRSSVTWRSALSVACSPCPPPSATAFTGRPVPLLTAEVTVHHGGQDATGRETVGELLGHHHLAVLTAGAPDGEGQVP